MDNISKLTQLSQGFFESLCIDFTDLEVTENDSEKHIYTIKISSTDSPLLIGPHGKTLEETQSLLVQMSEKILDVHCIIHLEINDYLAEKQKRLFSIVERKIELLQKNNIEQVVYELSSYERKLIHAYVCEKYDSISTKSMDGEKGRELHIMFREWYTPQKVESSSTWRNISKDLESIDLEGTNI